MGEPYYTKQFAGTKSHLKEKFDSFQYVPLFDTLKMLLCDPTILEEIEYVQIVFIPMERLNTFVMVAYLVIILSFLTIPMDYKS